MVTSLGIVSRYHTYLFEARMNGRRHFTRRGSPASRQRSRDDRNIVLLVLIPAAAVLFAAYHYHLGVAANLISLMLGGGVALASFYIAWMTFRQGKTEPSAGGIERGDVEKFAKAVSTEWSEELEKNRFRGPSRQLAISWAPADRSLTVSWDALLEQARRGPSTRHGGTQPASWATSPDELAGREDELPAVLRRVPTGRLMVLGTAGSGKTMLMIRLVLGLLAQRKSGDPVPVLLSATTWNPDTHSLYDWLQEQLSLDYPALGTALPDGSGKSIVSALLDELLIIPVLDGLDEMPPGARALAIDHLNRALDSPRCPPQLVMTCRTEPYRQDVGAIDTPRHLLAGAAVVELRPLDPRSITSYLAGQGEAERWAPVLKAVSETPDAPVAKAMSSPLYASLAFEIYNQSSQPPSGGAPDPRSLCNQEKFPTAEAIKEHLLARLIPAKYLESRRDKSAEFDPGNAEHWLRFLAAYLRDKSTSSLQWWDLAGIVPGWQIPAMIGLIYGASTAVVVGAGRYLGVTTGISFGTGLLVALAIALIPRYAMHRWKPARCEGIDAADSPLPGVVGALIGGMAGAIAAGIAARHGIGDATSPVSGLPAGVGIGVGTGASARFTSGLFGALIGSCVAGCIAGGYLGTVAHGALAALIDGLSVGLATGIAIANRGRRKPARPRGKWEPRYGIAGGAVIGLAMGFIAGTEENIAAGAAVGLLTGIAAAYPIGLPHREEDLDYVPSPGEALSRDARAFRRTVRSAGLAAGAIGLCAGSLTSIYQPGATLSVFVSAGIRIGLLAGIIVGLTFGFYHSASPKFRIINWYLALQGNAPWRLQYFLNDAYSKGVLRQVGSAYQFRHELLKEHLADHSVVFNRRGITHTLGNRSPMAFLQPLADRLVRPFSSRVRRRSRA
jgi:NACHT domain